uniref:Uncharacterized protein n=1 Tax=Chenopodium quinoa TaxID=63459 RepID=A0A803NEL7_CHEQI
MAEEDEVTMEVEAAEAVYGDDCIVLNRFPPHLRLHIKPQDKHSDAQPFMKLMSCFHCFTELRKMMGDSTGNCPVCRKVFLAKDIEHISWEDTVTLAVLFLISYVTLAMFMRKSSWRKSSNVIWRPVERQKFETILELQQQHGGLIEPPKDNVLFSRLSLQDLVSEDAEVMNEQTSEQQHNNQIAREEPESSNSSNRTRETRKQRPRGHNNAMEPASGGPPTRSNAGHRRYSGPRKHNNNNSRWQAKPCPKKE